MRRDCKLNFSRFEETPPLHEVVEIESDDNDTFFTAQS